MPKILYRQLYILLVIVCAVAGVVELTLVHILLEDGDLGVRSFLGLTLLSGVMALVLSAAILIVLHIKVGHYLVNLLDISSRSNLEKILHLEEGSLPDNEIADLFLAYEKLLFSLEENQHGLGVRLHDAEKNLLRAAKFSATGELTSTIVHDIRSPLSSVIGYSQLALERFESGEPVKEEHLRKILRAAEHIHDLVKRMSLFARHSEDLYEGVSLGECIEDTKMILEHHMTFKKVQLDTKAVDPEWRVFGNKQLVIQILVNLLSNAVDALEHCSNKVVEIEVVEGDDHFEVFVRDFGPGIPDEHLRSIFRPFFTTKGEGKGTGLGLASCRDIASRLGSKLTAKNRDTGTGAIFHLRLWKTEADARCSGSFAQGSQLSAVDPVA